MWPFKHKRTGDFESWPIVRTKPVGRTYGRSVSLFINNWQCHLTTVDVYADGSIDCWGFVDRQLFDDKLRLNWVVAAPKPNQELSVFNFGFTGVVAGKWRQTPKSISEEVDSIIKTLNPEMGDLLDMHGSDTEVRGKVRCAKLGLSDKKPYRRDLSRGEDVLADSVPVLRVIEGGFELTRLVAYSDGMCRIGQADELFPISDVASLYDRERIKNVAPAGSKIVLSGLGEFRTANEFGYVSTHDRIAEIHDKVNELNGRPSVITICAKLFEEYERDPSPHAKEQLRKAYEAVPEHLRCYCGDMDTRDTAIRAALYGEDVG